jgi:hypothetical protein
MKIRIAYTSCLRADAASTVRPLLCPDLSRITTGSISVCQRNSSQGGTYKYDPGTPKTQRRNTRQAAAARVRGYYQRPIPQAQIYSPEGKSLFDHPDAGHLSDQMQENVCSPGSSG